MKQWHYRQYQKAQVQRFAQQEGIDPLFAALLAQRGMNTHEAVKGFVRPDITHVSDPFLLPDMDRAVQRILLARERGEQVTVFGDYDVDGLTSTTVVYNCLRSLGIKVNCYIPDRMNEGYGLNWEALKQIQAEGTSLVVTVDLGVTAVEEINAMKEMDFVITDHHQPLEELPAAAAVVDPKREDCQAPFRELAGVGVAFKLVCALLRDRPLAEILREYIDLVCLGTIADIVPLYGENRFFARCGLLWLERTKRPGLKALLRESGYRNVDATAVGFGLAPRINAAGRMGSAKVALELLLTQDQQRGNQLAAELCRLNSLRQQTEQMIYTQADRLLQSGGTDAPVLVASGQGWHQGVIGIVASKLMNRYDKPVVLLSVEDGVAHGSARSVEGFPIFDALYECQPYLIRFGGHAKAAGMTLAEEQIPAFTEEINQVALAVMEDGMSGGLLIDLAVEPEQVTMELAKKLIFFEPFGTGNPQPIFSMADMRVVDCAPTKDGKHLRMTVQRGTYRFSCIGFGMGEDVVPPGTNADIAFCVAVNQFRGKSCVNLILKDIHPLI